MRPTATAQGNIQGARTRYFETPNVQWITYFNGDQAFHGVYWHNNFGNRMSHGCVGMPIRAPSRSTTGRRTARMSGSTTDVDERRPVRGAAIS